MWLVGGGGGRYTKDLSIVKLCAMIRVLYYMTDAVSVRVVTVLIFVSLRLHVQNAVPAQPCVGKLGISLVLLNFLHCNFRLWFKTT